MVLLILVRTGAPAHGRRERLVLSDRRAIIRRTRLEYQQNTEGEKRTERSWINPDHEDQKRNINTTFYSVQNFKITDCQI